MLALVYERRHRRERFAIALNFAATPRTVRLPCPATVMLSTHLDRTESAPVRDLQLRAHAGAVLDLAG